MADRNYIEQLKQIPVVQILQDFYGVEVQKRGERYYCKIRPERTGSCVVYSSKNDWYDFGAGVGGDSIELVKFMDNCDIETAMKKLSDYYGITPVYEKRTDSKMLWDNEWREIGIYPEKASKNLDINCIQNGEPLNKNADINLNIDNSEQVKTFAQKYYVSMNELRKTDPVSYHHILKKKSLIPIFIGRDDYYNSLLSWYRIMKDIGGYDFAVKAVSKDEALIDKSQQINKRCLLLRRATDDASLLKVPALNLSPSEDIQGILSGTISFPMTQMQYYDLLKLSKSCNETLLLGKVSYQDYVSVKSNSESKLDELNHSVYFKKGTCYLYFLKKEETLFKNIFSDCNAKVDKIIDNFSTERGKKAAEMPLKPNSFI